MVPDMQKSVTRRRRLISIPLSLNLTNNIVTPFLCGMSERVRKMQEIREKYTELGVISSKLDYPHLVYYDFLSYRHGYEYKRLRRRSTSNTRTDAMMSLAKTYPVFCPNSSSPSVFFTTRSTTVSSSVRASFNRLLAKSAVVTQPPRHSIFAHL